MLATRRRTLLLLLAAIAPMAGCDTADKAPSAEVAAVPAPVLPPIQQEIASAKAEVTLPGVWQYGYRLVDRADTTNGAYRAYEFFYAEAGNTKVPPRLLLVIRVFTKAGWDKISATQEGVATKLAVHGTDVLAFSIVTTNPYPLNSPAALRVDQMMLALMAEGSPFKITFK